MLVLCVTQVFAQDRTITGTVTASDDGLPLPGVSVKIKGSDVGIATDARGAFSISAPNNAVLVFSFVSFVTQEVPVAGRSTINVSLVADNKYLNEVVVVGYGSKTVREINGSIANVDGAKISEQPIESFAKGLAGKMAGVQVSSAGGTLADGIRINIRGTNSISSGQNPLYVIDGVPFNYSDNLSVFNGGNGTRFDPMALINPADIENITVLKDAGAGAIYGSRAANGVILITTKKGKTGAAEIRVDSKQSWASASKKPNLLGADDFMTINNEKVENRWPGVNGKVAVDSDIDGDGKADRTNWMDQIFRTGFQTDNTVNISGGSEKAKFYGSARYIDQKGILYGNRLQTANVRINSEITPNKYVRAGISLAYTHSKNDGLLTDAYLAGAAISGYNAFPTVSPYNPNSGTERAGYNITASASNPEGFGYLGLGNNKIFVKTTPTGNATTGLIGNRISNPLAVVDLNRNQLTPSSLLANTFLDIKPIDGLTLTTKFGVDLQRNFEDQYSNPVNSGLGSSYNGLVQDNYLSRDQWNWQNYITFDRTIAQKHRVTVVAGTEYQFNKRRETYVGAMNFADPFFKDILDNTYSQTAPGSTAIENLTGGVLNSSGLESYFGRLGYIFDDKYSIEGAYRTDAFSGFGQNYKWGKFPSLSVGWIVSEEDFLKGNKVISYLKIRGSYGKTGNSAGVGAYAARTLYGGGLYAGLNGFSSSQLGNADLRWESQLKTDIGFNMGLFDGRISVDADYFNNNIDGLILNAPVLYTVGVPNSSITTNIGAMRNRGFEITINSTNIVTKDFRWTTSLNFTSVKNKVIELVAANGNADIVSASTVASVGRPLGTYKLIEWAGVNPANGYPMWYTANGTIKQWDQANQRYALMDGSATTALTATDQKYMEGKTGTPTYFGGFDNTFTYKNIDLNVSFVYSGGNYLYNTTFSGLLTNNFQNNDARIMNRWTTPGQVTDVPRVYSLDNTANQASTRFLEKADFARLRLLALGYTFNKSAIKAIGLSSLRLSAQVYNLLTITGYSGIDPEVNSNRNNTNIATGYDNRAIPQPRTYTIGLNASF